jgi:hypothetical protein
VGILGEISRKAGPALLDELGASILPSQRRALHDFAACRTPALGGHVYTCTSCHRIEYSYHSCRNRHCPQCQHGRGEAWIAAQRDRILPCDYYLLTFTLPALLRDTAWQHQRIVYDALMRAAAEATQKLLLDPRYLGAVPGMISVLHTWTRDLRYHPHVHMLVTAGGLSPDGTAWHAPARSRFLVPGRVLSAVFRGKMRDHLAREGLTATLPRRVWRSDWVVHVKHAGDGHRVIDYLGRYLFRAPIPESRIESFRDGRVTFRYQDHKTRVMKRCTLRDTSFLQRLLQHVLPRGFTRVRHYGCLSASSRERRERARALIERTPPIPRASVTEVTEPPALDPAEVPASRPCPHCDGGRMIITDRLRREPRTRRVPRGPP